MGGHRMNIAVADDSTSDSAFIADIIREYAAEKRLDMNIFTYGSGEEFLADGGKREFDIAFMDVCMTGISGIETALSMREKNTSCLLIFLTSSAEYMADAFSCHAFDYIVKPAEKSKVYKALDDAMKLIPGKSECIAIENGKETILMPFSSFCSASCSDHYMFITDVNGHTIKSRMAFSAFCEAFSGNPAFLVINRGTAVSMDCISDIADGACIMKNGETLPIKVREYGKIQNIWHKYRFDRIRSVQKV